MPININVIQILIVVPPLLMALTFHEAAHAWAANRLGDPTARLQGRLSLNPLVHLDPIGTLVLIFTMRIGWAKPVPVDTRYLRNPRRDMFWIAAAGPLANLTQAFVLGSVIRLLGKGHIYAVRSLFHSGVPMNVVETLVMMLFMGFAINIFLAWFNLIPLPPLDGSKIALRFMSPEASLAYLRFGRYGVLVLVFLLFTPFQTVFWSIITPPVRLTGYLLGGISPF